MSELGGFHVNTNVRIKSNKPLWKKLLRHPYIKIGIALVLVAVIVILFLAIVPLKTLRYKESCTAVSTNGTKTVTYYDKNGRIDLEEGFYGEDVVRKADYQYDKKGRLIKVEHFSFNKLSETEKYVYSGSLLSEKHILDESSVLMSKTVYTYVDGVLELHTEYDKEGNAVSEQKYIYENNKLIKTENVKIASEDTVTTNLVYENGKVVKEKQILNGGEEKNIRYTFDSKGNMLSKTEKNNVYTLYSYTFKDRKVSVFY